MARSVVTTAEVDVRNPMARRQVYLRGLKAFGSNSKRRSSRNNFSESIRRRTECCLLAAF
jgi:hypothetical protein